MNEILQALLFIIVNQRVIKAINQKGFEQINQKRFEQVETYSSVYKKFHPLNKIILIPDKIKMKALMTNSTQPHICTAKVRDEMYLRHLREVQKINNREYVNLKTQVQYYNNVAGSVEKHRKQAKQFQITEHNTELGRKNQQIMVKMKNMRSMYNFNLKKPSDIEQSQLSPDQSIIIKESNKNDRYSKQNDQKQQISQINMQISQSIANGLSKLQKNESPKGSRLSLHYYLRKRQQEMIEHENQKLKKGILSQKSTYGSPRRLNRSLKLPGVKSARHNFNERTIQIYGNKVQGETTQINANSRDSQLN